MNLFKSVIETIAYAVPASIVLGLAIKGIGLLQAHFRKADHGRNDLARLAK